MRKSRGNKFYFIPNITNPIKPFHPVIGIFFAVISWLYRYKVFLFNEVKSNKKTSKKGGRTRRRCFYGIIL